VLQLTTFQLPEVTVRAVPLLYSWKERKRNEEYLYSAFLAKVVHSKRSGNHTVLPANNTMPAFPSWAFTKCHHHSNWGSGHPIAAHYSFIDPERMKGWVACLVGWPIADGLPTLVVTHQLQVERRTAKARRPKTDVLPLDHATTLSFLHCGNVEGEGSNVLRGLMLMYSRYPLSLEEGQLYCFLLTYHRHGNIALRACHWRRRMCYIVGIALAL